MSILKSTTYVGFKANYWVFYELGDEMLKGMTIMYINCDKGFVIWPKLIIYSGNVRSSDCGLYILIVN